MTPSPISIFAARLSDTIRSWQAAEGIQYVKITCEEQDPDLMTAHYVVLSRRGTVKDAGSGGAHEYRTARLINDIIELQRETGIRIGQVIISQGGHKLLIWYVDATGRPRYHPYTSDRLAQVEEATA